MQRRPFLCLIVCLLSLRGVAAEPIEHALDGVTCTVQMVQGGKDKDRDTLVFAKGMGSAPGLAKAYGFVPGPYAMTRKGNDASFGFTVTDPEHGQVEFTGLISGDRVSGTRTWSKPGRDPIVFTFSGSVARK